MSHFILQPINEFVTTGPNVWFLQNSKCELARERTSNINQLWYLLYFKDSWLASKKMITNMAGEGDRNESLSFSAPNSTCSFNLARLRERVKEYIDKVGCKIYGCIIVWSSSVYLLNNMPGSGYQNVGMPCIRRTGTCLCNPPTANLTFFVYYLCLFFWWQNNLFCQNFGCIQWFTFSPNNP